MLNKTKKNEVMLGNANSNTREAELIGSVEDMTIVDHERWKVAMDANSVLGAITKRTLEQLSQLIGNIERLIALLDECPIAGGLKSEWNDEFCEETLKLAQEIEQLAHSTRIPRPLIPRTGIYNSTLGTRTYAYLMFLHTLRADRSTWLSLPGSPFGDIEVLKLPDQLITFHQRVYEIYDRWTMVGDLRQATGEPSRYLPLSHRFDERQVEKLSNDQEFHAMVDRAYEHALTDADQKKLLQEMTNAAVVYAEEYRRE
jgi:hypothetical protein